MSFFDSIPEPPPPEPVQTEQPVWMRSDAVIPGSVPGETLLVRTGEVAVAIGSVRATRTVLSSRCTRGCVPRTRTERDPIPSSGTDGEVREP